MAEDLELFAYQQRTVRRIHKFGGRAVVALDMGLGKTAVGIKYYDEYVSWDRPAVVVAPATAKTHWRREFERWVGVRAEVLDGLEPYDPPKAHVYVVNPDVLAPHYRKTRFYEGWLFRLLKMKPRLVIADEIQMFSSPVSMRTRALRKLARKAPHFLALGGTGGINNRPAELWAVLNMIDKDEWPSLMDFGKRYCRARKSFGKWEFKGAENLGELRARLVESCMIRYRKEDVIKDLPARRDIVEPLDLADKERDKYEKAEEEFAAWLTRYYNRREGDKKVREEQVSRTTMLKNLVGRLKVPAVRDWTKGFLADTDEKLLVFGIQKENVVEKLHAAFPGSCLVTGDVRGGKRQHEFDRFNAPDGPRLFLGNVQAAGVAWSCKTADTVAFAEVSYVPGDHVQAADRVRGIGRGTGTRGATAYYLVAPDTVDEDLCRINQRKAKNIDKILDGGTAEGQMNLYDILCEQVMDRNRQGGK